MKSKIANLPTPPGVFVGLGDLETFRQNTESTKIPSLPNRNPNLQFFCSEILGGLGEIFEKFQDSTISKKKMFFIIYIYNHIVILHIYFPYIHMVCITVMLYIFYIHILHHFDICKNHLPILDAANRGIFYEKFPAGVVTSNQHPFVVKLVRTWLHLRYLS